MNKNATMVLAEVRAALPNYQYMNKDDKLVIEIDDLKQIIQQIEEKMLENLPVPQYNVILTSRGKYRWIPK